MSRTFLTTEALVSVGHPKAKALGFERNVW